MNLFGLCLRFGLALGSLTVAVACSKNATATACAPGQEPVCNCPGTSVPGSQKCRADGSGYEPCNCASTTTASGAGGASGSSTTSMTAPASSGSSTGPGGPGSGGAGGSGSADGMCTSIEKCDDCRKGVCAKGFCKAAFDKCDANQVCAMLIKCLDACMSTQCSNDCIAKYPAGANDFFATYTCTTCKPGPCYSECMGAQVCGGMGPPG